MKIVILDWDKNHLNDLANLIKKIDNSHSIETFNNPFSLVTYVYDVSKGNVDLMIIGLDDAGESIEMAKDIQDYYSHINLIFFSDDNKCIEDIFDAMPMYFLKVPIIQKKLEKNAVQKEVGNQFTIVSQGQYQKIRMDSVDYIESVGRKINIYGIEIFFETNMTMQNILEKLDGRFLQCHRSYIVNTTRIAKMSGDTIQMNNGEIIPVARGRMHQVKESLRLI